MSTEAEEIQRIVSASVRDMLDAFASKHKGSGDQQKAPPDNPALGAGLGGSGD